MFKTPVFSLIVTMCIAGGVDPLVPSAAAIEPINSISRHAFDITTPANSVMGTKQVGIVSQRPDATSTVISPRGHRIDSVERTDDLDIIVDETHVIAQAAMKIHATEGQLIIEDNSPKKIVERGMIDLDIVDNVVYQIDHGIGRQFNTVSRISRMRQHATGPIVGGALEPTPLHGEIVIKNRLISRPPNIDGSALPGIGSVSIDHLASIDWVSRGPG